MRNRDVLGFALNIVLGWRRIYIWLEPDIISNVWDLGGPRVPRVPTCMVPHPRFSIKRLQKRCLHNVCPEAWALSPEPLLPVTIAALPHRGAEVSVFFGSRKQLSVSIFIHCTGIVATLNEMHMLEHFHFINRYLVCLAQCILFIYVGWSNIALSLPLFHKSLILLASLEMRGLPNTPHYHTTDHDDHHHAHPVSTFARVVENICRTQFLP